MLRRTRAPRTTEEVVPRRARLLRLAGTVALLVAIAAWAALLRPPLLGGPTSYVLVTGTSMEPTMHHGDLAVIREHPTYEHGEVVAFHTEAGASPRDPMVIHRVVGGDGDAGYRLQGDNNDFRDPWRPRDEQVAGALWFFVPGAGRILAVLTQPVMFAGLVSGVTVFLALLRAPDSPRSAADAPTPAERAPR